MKGAYNQIVSNPIVSEIRQHRAVLARLLTQLKLPDEPGSLADRHHSAKVSEAARKAARARWGTPIA